MKKILMTVFALLCLVGCNQKTATKIEKDNNYYSYVDKISTDQIQNFEVNAELIHEYTPDYMKSVSDSIIIGTVDSIDASDMKYNNVVGYTYGTLSVQNILYGNLSKGEKIEFAKPGGIIEYSKWNSLQPQEDQEKRSYLSSKTNDKIPDYVDILLENDIHIEAGKNYLIYLKYSEDIKKYEIIGLGNGLREVIGVNKSIEDFSNLENLKIKNNNTNKVENLFEYVEKNIK